MTLPTLYKRTSTGKIEQWAIRVERDNRMDGGDGFAIITEHGHVGGKLQESSERVTRGKNLGKANETSALEQAEAQARSEWLTKKTRKGYAEELAKAEAGANDGAGGIRPMLAKSFSKDGDKIVFPCFAQPKLDGMRCIAVVGDDGKVALWTREQKPITSVPHIAEAVKALGLPAGTVLDGELYNHDLRNDFEKLISLARKQGTVNPETAKLIQYHIYDLPRRPGAEDHSFDSRHSSMVKISMLSKRNPCLEFVPTGRCESEDELLAYFAECRALGYEGCMARNADGPYEEGRRSPHLQKLKEFDENEYDIVGVYQGIGKMEGLAVFICSMEPGHPKLSREDAQALAAKDFEGTRLFGCKLEGTLEGLRKYLDDDSLWWGKRLTVQYQGLTSKRNVCRFPVGKAIRDYE